jgi:hypothetical protein
MNSNKASLLEGSSLPHSRKRQHKQVQPVTPNETLSDRDFHEMCLALAIIAEHIHARTKEQEAGEETHANV